MSDGDIWQPPDPGAAAPAPAPPEPPGRTRGKVVGATVAALAIVGAGTFAVARIAGDDAGGAATPEDAGQAFVDAIGNEDLLGVIDVMLPGEREALHGPLSELVDELRRLEVLSDEADASAISGIDIVVEDVSIDVEETNVDDISNVAIEATVTGSIDGEELPVGDWIRDEVGDDLAGVDERDTTEDDTLRLTAVEEDGRWYLSLFHTMAESVRIEAGAGDIPEEGLLPSGGDSPEAAMDVLLDAVDSLDLAAMLAGLDPREAQALQRYAPLFLDDAQAELDTAPFDISITDRSYSVEGSGDTREVVIDGVVVEVTDGEANVSMELRDGCWIVKAPDVEETNSCQAVEDVPALDEVFDDPQAIEDLVAAAQETFADYETPGLIVREVDGEWYLSPIATSTEQLLAVVRALTREEIEGLQALVGDAVDSVEQLTERQAAAPLDDEEEPAPPDPAEACWGESDAVTAAACFDDLIAAGEITASDSPWYLRYSECGLAQLGWSGDYYTLPDADFVATVDDAAPCFQALVESGEAGEFDLPIELLRPDCLAGINWYSSTDDEYLAEFEECAFG